MRFLGLLAALAVLGMAAEVSAQDEAADGLGAPPQLTAEAPSEGPLHVEVLAGTTAPIDVEVGARVTVFDVLLGGVSLGTGAYGSLYSGLARAGGGEGAGDLVGQLAGDVMVVNAYGGIRPFGRGGIELVAGYSRLGGSTTVDMSTFASAFGTGAAPEGSVTADWAFHALHLEIGWTFSVADSFLVRPAFGWTQVMGADVTMTATGSAASSAQMRQALTEGATAMEDAATTYGMMPTLSLAVGWRF
jgi:hypothetical protein